MTRRVYVDDSKCNGCRICELRCSFEHFKVYAPSYARIHIKKNEYEGLTNPKVCRQCEKPYCMAACPEGAITQNKLGIIQVDAELCTGCGLCEEACPFESVTMHPTAQLSLICDTCGGDPQCVAYCPEEALHFFTREENRAYKQQK